VATVERDVLIDGRTVSDLVEDAILALVEKGLAELTTYLAFADPDVDEAA
jgi:hypothetical protein